MTKRNSNRARESHPSSTTTRADTVMHARLLSLNCAPSERPRHHSPHFTSPISPHSRSYQAERHTILSRAHDTSVLILDAACSASTVSSSPSRSRSRSPSLVHRKEAFRNTHIARPSCYKYPPPVPLRPQRLPPEQLYSLSPLQPRSRWAFSYLWPGR